MASKRSFSLINNPKWKSMKRRKIWKAKRKGPYKTKNLKAKPNMFQLYKPMLGVYGKVGLLGSGFTTYLKSVFSYAGSHNNTSILYLFRWDSIYNPWGTHSTNQPLGYDQLATLFGRYRVPAAYARIQMCVSHNREISGSITNNLSDTATLSGSLEYGRSTQVTIFNSTDNNAPTGTEDAMLRSGSHTVVFNDGESRIIPYKMVPRNVQGINMNESDNNALITASPTHRPTYTHLILQWGAADTRSTRFTIELVQKVHFYDPIRVTASY